MPGPKKSAQRRSSDVGSMFKGDEFMTEAKRVRRTTPRDLLSKLNSGSPVWWRTGNSTVAVVRKTNEADLPDAILSSLQKIHRTHLRIYGGHCHCNSIVHHHEAVWPPTTHDYRARHQPADAAGSQTWCWKQYFAPIHMPIEHRDHPYRHQIDESDIWDYGWAVSPSSRWQPSTSHVYQVAKFVVRGFVQHP